MLTAYRESLLPQTMTLGEKQQLAPDNVVLGDDGLLAEGIAGGKAEPEGFVEQRQRMHPMRVVRQRQKQYIHLVSRQSVDQVGGQVLTQNDTQLRVRLMQRLEKQWEQVRAQGR